MLGVPLFYDSRAHLAGEALALFVSKALREMVVDESRGLREGVDDSRTAEFEAPLLEFFRHCTAHGCFRRNIIRVFPFVLHGLAIDEAPEQMRKAFGGFLYFEKGLSIGDRCLNLPAMSYDALVAKELIDLFLVKGSDFLGVEALERMAEVFALAQNCYPRKPCLKPIKHQLLE